MPSGLYVPTMVGVLRQDIALDLDSTAHKLALFNGSIAPNLNTDTAYGVGTYASNEVTGTGWPAGGIALSAAGAGGTSTAPTFGPAGSGVAVYDMGNVAVSGVTATGIHYLQLYADALAGNNAILLIDLGGDYPVDGVLRVLWRETGVFTWAMGGGS